jgi:ankyrin repeat protein
MLHDAAESGHCEVVELLFDQGADVNATGGRHGSVLMAAVVGAGWVDSVRLQLDSGAAVNDGDDGTSSALAMAQRKGNYEAVELLQERGAIGQRPRQRVQIAPHADPT